VGKLEYCVPVDCTAIGLAQLKSRNLVCSAEFGSLIRHKDEFISAVFKICILFLNVSWKISRLPFKVAAIQWIRATFLVYDICMYIHIYLFYNYNY
jgi:hypothetical protein